MSDSTEIAELVTEVELDSKILQLRLAGMSIRRLAKEFRMHNAAVLDSLDRSLPPLDHETRVRLYREDLSRLDDLLMAFYAQAKEGNPVSAGLCLRFLERRAEMLGSDAPQRVDVVLGRKAEQGGSTAKLLEALDRIAAERDGSIVEHVPEP